MSEKSIKGKENHASGYNCAQAVVSAFDEIPNCNILIKAASSFGGGVGGQHQVCGAVSGMCMIAGVKNGYDTPEKGTIKQEQGKLVRAMCDDFKAVAGSIVCGELLGLKGFNDIGIEKKLPCPELVKLGIEIAEKHLK